MWLNIWQIVLQIVVILCFHSYGMYVMVCAYSALLILWLLPWHHYAGRLIHYRWRDMMLDMTPFFLAAAGVMVVTYYATVMVQSLWLLLATRVCLAAILYYVVMKVAGAEILKECERFVIRSLRRG